MKIELHSHSSEISPCGFLTVEELIDIYSGTDCDMLVLTNHFSRLTVKQKNFQLEDFHRLYHETIRKAQEIGRKKGLQVLGAYELRFDENANDYLVYGMKEEQCRDVEKMFSMTAQQFSDFASENGILFYQAHPFRNNMTVVKPELLFGIEILNTHPRHDSRNDIAESWAEKFGLHKIAGSDCHRIQDVGGCAILTDHPVKNMDDLTFVLANDLFTIWRKN